MLGALWLAFLCVAGCQGASHAGRTAVRVAAASDLAPAIPALGKAFERAHDGVRVDTVLGSSGLLSRQIAEGAPYDALLAADESYVARVVRAGACDPATRRAYALGRIVLWTPSGVPAPRSLGDLLDPHFRRIAIANPEHAPYGKAAKQALERARLWSQLEGRIVRGENVRATFELARTGNADAAIVAASIASEGHRLAIDESLHDPLVQTAVACSGGRAAGLGRAFVAFVASAAGGAVLSRFGLGGAEASTP